MAASRNKTQPLNTSSSDTSLCFHRSENTKRQSIINHPTKDYFRSLSLPLTSQLEQQDPPAQLVAIRKHYQNVVLEDVGLLRRHQPIVQIFVLQLERVISLDLQKEFVFIISRKTTKILNFKLTRSLALSG